jgi:oxygen-independent coproporphyrinogen-3 oxidase
MNLPPPTAELLAKYGKPVPRYTSYPTAPHFSPLVGAARYGEWLESLGGTVEPLSLYLHIPFCRSLCWFCGCSTRVVNNYNPVESYLKLLIKEIGLVTERLGPGRKVSHIHFGGGTPTMLSAGDLERLAAALRDHFAVADEAEFAVEIDPRVLTAEQAAALGRMGVTRASLGVQDFAPIVQKAINRIQPYETTLRAIEALRAHGVSRINLDLLYGLPHQTVEGVVATVDRALTLEPDRLAIFGYAHVPWMKKHQQLVPEDALPDAAARFAQAGAAAARLVECGYMSIGLDHFARPDDPMAKALAAGRLGRNFQGYTTDAAETLIGLGASAIGALPQGYVQNSAEVRPYGEAIAGGQLAAVRGIATDAEDRLRRDLIEQLMCGFEVALDETARRHGYDPAILIPERAVLAGMAADGLVVLEDGVLRVTETGRPFVRSVCAVFDGYLRKGAARHSIAV